MFNALQGLCTGSSSVSLGLIVTAESYSLLYSIQSPCGSSSPYEGAVCVVFKMALQPNTCKLIIHCFAQKNASTCVEIFTLRNNWRHIVDISRVKLLSGHLETFLVGGFVMNFIAILHKHTKRNDYSFSHIIRSTAWLCGTNGKKGFNIVWNTILEYIALSFLNCIRAIRHYTCISWLVLHKKLLLFLESLHVQYLTWHP